MLSPFRLFKSCEDYSDTLSPFQSFLLQGCHACWTSRKVVLRVGTQAVGACAGAPLTRRQLDDACEAHLQQRFGEKLDFAVENSLPFLIHDGLVQETADVRPPASWLHRNASDPSR